MASPIAELVRIATDNLQFDEENPRLPGHVDGADEQDVLDWMLLDAGLVELMGAIAEQGFFPAEPLLVIPMASDRYAVLEGNRRLAAVKLLRTPERAPSRKRAVLSMAASINDRASLEALPCVVFRTRDEVLDYLGYRHITGIKQWEPAAKARYLQELYNVHVQRDGDVYQTLARKIGSRSDYVRRLLGALALFERIVELRVEGVDPKRLPFSVLTLALNYSVIADFLHLESKDLESYRSVDGARLEELAIWLFRNEAALGRTQLGESRNMRLLAAAVSSQSGLNALRAGQTAEEAAQESIDVDALMRRALRISLENVRAAQSFVHRVDDLGGVAQVAEDIEEVSGQILALIQRRARRQGRADV